MEPIFNIQAEQEVLSSVLMENDTLLQISEVLEPSDFYLEKHSILYQAMQSLYAQEKPIDMTTLTEFFKGDFESIGGFKHLTEIIKSGISFNIEHSKIIKEKANMRKLQLMLSDTLNNFSSKDFQKTMLELQEKTLSFDTKEESQYITDTQMMAATLQTIERNYNNKGEILGLKCGISILDKAISGFQRQMVYTIAGRPSMGKSALVINIAQNMSEKYRGLLYSMEMNEFQIGVRRLAMNSFLDSAKIRTGSINLSEWDKVARASCKVASGKCLTNCKSSIHVNEIYNQGKKMKLQGGVDFIIIDHLGLVDKTGMGPDIRQQTTNIMIRLKTLAKELDCPVIILSQLSRGVEQRADKHPMLSDLKESAGVEENSDIVLLLYRDEYYNKDTNKKNIIEVDVAKQRDGRTGRIELTWRPEYQIITDIYKG